MKGCLLGSQAGVAAGSLNKKWARMRRQVKKEQRCLNESLSGARQHGALLSALSAGTLRRFSNRARGFLDLR